MVRHQTQQGRLVPPMRHVVTTPDEGNVRLTEARRRTQLFSRNTRDDGCNDTGIRIRAKLLPVSRRWRSVGSASDGMSLQQPSRVSDSGLASSERARVLSYADVFEQYEWHPETKSAALDGSPCAHDTCGLLGRRHVLVETIARIGRESNEYEEVEAGAHVDRGDVLNIYHRARPCATCGSTLTSTRAEAPSATRRLHDVAERNATRKPCAGNPHARFERGV
jgi:hypothetical protein